MESFFLEIITMLQQACLSTGSRYPWSSLNWLEFVSLRWIVMDLQHKFSSQEEVSVKGEQVQRTPSLINLLGN